MNDDEAFDEASKKLEKLILPLWLILQLSFKTRKVTKDEKNLSMRVDEVNISFYYINETYWEMELKKRGNQIASFRGDNNLKALMYSVVSLISDGKKKLKESDWHRVKIIMKSENMIITNEE